MSRKYSRVKSIFGRDEFLKSYLIIEIGIVSQKKRTFRLKNVPLSNGNVKIYLATFILAQATYLKSSLRKKM